MQNTTTNNTTEQLYQDECLGFCEKTTVHVREEEKKCNLQKILTSFQECGESDGFSKFVTIHGLQGPQFCYREPTQALKNRFHDAIMEAGALTSTSDGTTTTDAEAPSSSDGSEGEEQACTVLTKKHKKNHPSLSSCTIGLVFHGTPENNVEKILKNGLDPTRRSGQVFGKGEYFAKEPNISISYCRGGKKMLVFLVIVPTKNINRSKPADYVVVENNHHQLPIGYVSFSAVDQAAATLSIARRNQLRALNLEAEKLERKSDESKMKAKIIQLIIQNEIESASHRYQKYFSTLLTEQSRKEIVLFAKGQRDLDFELVSYYFPGVDEEDVAGTKQEEILDGIQSVEKQESLAMEARKKVKDAANSLIPTTAQTCFSR